MHNVVWGYAEVFSVFSCFTYKDIEDLKRNIWNHRRSMVDLEHVDLLKWRKAWRVRRKFQTSIRGSSQTRMMTKERISIVFGEKVTISRSLRFTYIRSFYTGVMLREQNQFANDITEVKNCFCIVRTLWSLSRWDLWRSFAKCQC